MSAATSSRPLKNYARTAKHDPSKNRTHEIALTEKSPPLGQPKNISGDQMETSHLTTPNDKSSTYPINHIDNSNEETGAMEVTIDAPLSPSSELLLDNFTSSMNEENAFGTFDINEFALDFEETVPEPFELDALQDEGYSTAGSNSGKSTPTNGLGGEQAGETEKEFDPTEASLSIPSNDNVSDNQDGNSIEHEANIEASLADLYNINDTGLLDIHRAEESPSQEMHEAMEENHAQVLDLDAIMKESSNIQFVVVDQPPAELPVAPSQEFTLVATYNNYPEMILANPSLGVETKKEPRRHTKGPKKADLNEIPEENHSNVKRCRKYRENKKIKAFQWQDELEALETRNKELREQEKAMVERLAKVQGAYINLIKAGRIKCV